MLINFTQYLRPNGRRTSVNIERPDAITSKAYTLQAAGYEFAIEELTTSAISMTVEHRDGDRLDLEGSLAHEITSNTANVSVAVDRLINTAYVQWTKLYEANSNL